MSQLQALGLNLDERSLPNAISWLFQSNGYSVTGPLQVHGSEIDLLAEQKGGYGAQKIYIEATVQHVDVAKFGKDLTKLTLVAGQPGTRCLIVSSKGFTVAVKERAAAVGIDTLTYDELYRSFGNFGAYVDATLTDPELTDLANVYIEPDFADQHGTDAAVKYVTDWVGGDGADRWMIVVGEYGTGKTALTKELQRKLMEAHSADPTKPIPFRIELRTFTKQFDARGLLHRFLDDNDLGHLSIDYVESLIAGGGVVLLLDGYDEMAQYLTLRERRACLEAMSHFGSGGSKGILTSRPNYFTEAEELGVYEALYRQLETRISLSEVDRVVRDEEGRIDTILERFILDRAERTLRDLSPEQTEELLGRRLADDPEGMAVVLGLLRQITRHLDSGDTVALSGKPVIISYLIEVVEELKRDQEGIRQDLGEWQIFSLIADKLMLRDWRRSHDIMPAQRLQILEDLAVLLAQRENRHIQEREFKDFVKSSFRDEIRKREAQGVVDPGESLFQDIRSSVMLTRAEGQRGGWMFSHNSLREFLLVRRLTATYLSDGSSLAGVVITDAMQTLVRSMGADNIDKLVGALRAIWPNRRNSRAVVSQMFTLLWPAVRKSAGAGGSAAALSAIVGDKLDISGVAIYRNSFSTSSSPSALKGLTATGVELSDVDFYSADLTEADFSGSILESVNFRDAVLTGASFENALLIGVSLIGAQIRGAVFLGLDDGSSAYVLSSSGQEEELTGEALVGFLRHCGAGTDDVEPYHVFAAHRDFRVIDKVCRFLAEEGWRQRTAIEQKGFAKENIPLARQLVGHFLSCGYLEERHGGGNRLVKATAAGRAAFRRFIDDQKADKEVAAAMERYMT